MVIDLDKNITFVNSNLQPKLSLILDNKLKYESNVVETYIKFIYLLVLLKADIRTVHFINKQKIVLFIDFR
jgi:hypothetical protein